MYGQQTNEPSAYADEYLMYGQQTNEPSSYEQQTDEQLTFNQQFSEGESNLQWGSKWQSDPGQYSGNEWQTTLKKSGIPVRPTPEAITPEAAAPEAITPEAAAPEAITPEAAAPEATAPEAAAPEATAPEAAASAIRPPADISSSRFQPAESTLPEKRNKIFQVRKMKILEDRLWMDIEWPEEIEQVLVLYGEDGYAKNPKDYRGKAANITSKAKYQKDTCIYLENIKEAEYFISLYGGCIGEGEIEYRDEIHVRYDHRRKEKIEYSIRIKGLLERHLEIEFYSAGESFQLPAIDIVVQKNTVPIDSVSGDIIAHIEKQYVEKSYLWTCPVHTLPKSSCIKAFFSDVASYDRISLRPAYGTKFKVR